MPHALTIRKIDGKPGQVYYPLQLDTVPKPVPGPGEVLVRLRAAALNHRDHFIRQHLYPGISFGTPLLADGFGTVEAVGTDARDGDNLVGKDVILTPSRGWSAAPEGPEGGDSKFGIIGASLPYKDLGMAQDYIVVPRSELEISPKHLSPAEAAALPLVGLTAWRALVTKSANAKSGRNILVTGIGGGVALQALQFGVAMGCNVYVTSSDQGKISRAVDELGARGGVSYKEQGWEKKLLALLPAERRYFDALIDGAGGDVVGKAVRLLKVGGVISQYGMTVSPKMDWAMSAVLRNIELRGSTMGSRAEFRDMVRFVAEHEIRPVVSRVVRGLDNLDGINGLFEDMRDGKQFGKLVIEIASSASSTSSKNEPDAKL